MDNLFAKAAGPAKKSGVTGGNSTSGNSSPAYMKALEMAMSRLYEEGAAEGLAKALSAAPDPAQAMAEQARLMLQGVDDMTGGEVADEEFMALGLELLGEVAEIAEGAGMALDGKTIAMAAREFILGVTEDLGGDTAPVREAMASMDPAEIGGALETVGV
jgi:hypothetical protein